MTQVVNGRERCEVSWPSTMNIFCWRFDNKLVSVEIRRFVLCRRWTNAVWHWVTAAAVTCQSDTGSSRSLWNLHWFSVLLYVSGAVDDVTDKRIWCHFVVYRVALFVCLYCNDYYYYYILPRLIDVSVVIRATHLTLIDINILTVIWISSVGDYYWFATQLRVSSPKNNHQFAYLSCKRTAPPVVHNFTLFIMFVAFNPGVDVGHGWS